MKIMLTGGSGMVGRNILEHKQARKFEIIAPSSNELNLLNYSNVLSYISVQKPDLIIHAAGRVGGIQANIKSPVNFLLDNMDMGRNIVSAAKESNVRNLINLGSSCMYPRNAENPLKEEMILCGELEPTNEGYALAKIATARLCEYIHREDNSFHYKTLIPCNLYGRWDKFDPAHSHMIPAVIRKIDKANRAGSTQVDIWGDGTARREFMYAGDLADFILHVIERIEQLAIYTNVGLGYDYSISEYYSTIANVIGFKGEFVYDLSKPVGMKQKLVDIEKQSLLGWVPRTKLVDGIKNTYDFYLSHGG